MSEPVDESAPALFLELDVAEFLHELADQMYGGDVQMAMNESLRGREGGDAGTG